MVARIDDRPVGFFLGFELKPDVFFSWFYGVLPEYRRQGIASQLMEAVHGWAQQKRLRIDSLRVPQSAPADAAPGHRPEYDIVGIRWDPDRGANLVLFRKGA